MPFLETPIGGRQYYLRSDLVRATSRLQEATRLDKFQGRGKDGQLVRDRETAVLKVWDRNALNLPAVMKTAQDVIRWQQTVYLDERQKLNNNTSKHLRKILELRGLDQEPAELLRSPTLQKTIKFWHRDLQELSLHAFFTIQPVVLREAFSSQGRHPDDFPRVRDMYNTTPRFRYCALCPQSMKKYDLAGIKKHAAVK
ncbi:hypothetical protein MVEN_00216400 [Mycena venus]|uniref:Uncharacterized protein n=1 Tax=Mycena venus TaxID=2733690 RepID=A0A8H7DC20_9AGAR|nr:hypothetical protein MVEN_00216400 [Mycena venus]